MRRRTVLASLLPVPGASARQAPGPSPLARPIPSSGEAIPLVGLGSWRAFDVGDDPAARERCAEVMRQFFAAGGRLIDSSPMYGSAQGVIGAALERLGATQHVFAADKVWTAGDGAAQVEASRRAWRVPRFDLLQVHNLVAWERQLPLLLRMKAQQQVRYVGITTSEGRGHDAIERILRREPIDFVQFTYNLAEREAEQRLLPLARDRGVAVLANRPFGEGDLLRRLQRHPLPGWAREIGCASWAQVALKFVISHAAVTSAIPATGRTDHVRENMAAAAAPLPDEAMRHRIAAHVARL